MNTVKLYCDALPNIPWQEKPNAQMIPRFKRKTSFF